MGCGDIRTRYSNICILWPCVKCVCGATFYVPVLSTVRLQLYSKKQNKETKEYHSVMAFVWHFYRFYLIGSPPSAPPFSSLIRSRTGVLLRLARRIGLVLSVFTTLSSPRRAHPIASTPVGSARTPSRRRPRDRTESAPTAQHRQLLPCAGSIARHHP